MEDTELNSDSAVHRAYPGGVHDYERYPSALLGTEMEAPWTEFYRHGLAESSDVLSQYRHQLAKSYARLPDQFLDILFPAAVAPGTAALIYFHGGRWAEGHPVFYHSLAEPWLRRGVTVILPQYRLLPTARLVDAVDDAKAALRWVVANATELEIDTARIHVCGHSAGAHLSSILALTSAAGTRLAGAMLMSGVYDVAQFAPDIAGAADLNPIRGLAPQTRNVLISFGDPEINRRGDGASFAHQGRLLSAALADAGVPHETVVLPNTNHVSTARAFGDECSPLFKAALNIVMSQ